MTKQPQNIKGFHNKLSFLVHGEFIVEIPGATQLPPMCAELLPSFYSTIFQGRGSKLFYQGPESEHFWLCGSYSCLLYTSDAADETSTV